MSTPRRTLSILVLLGALGTSCTGGGSVDVSTRTPTEAPTSQVPTGRFQPGEYRYEFGGVTASLSFDGSGARMDVKNASGAELAAPGVYVVNGSGAQRDGVVIDAVPIPDGDSVTFQVTFPREVTPKTIGLVILLFGESNYGAFAPAPAA